MAGRQDFAGRCCFGIIGMSKASLNIDQINILLMLAACGLAYLIPFELVLLSYAFLGPAHYLTQISWMHDRSYFVGAKWLLWAFMFIAALLILFAFYENIEAESFLLYAIAISLSIALIAATKWHTRILLTLAFASGLMTVQYFLPHFRTAILILLPTVIHIYVFTGLFIFLGALKNKNNWGFLSFMIFLACTLIFLFIAPAQQIMLPEFVNRNIIYFSEISDYLASILSFNGVVDGHGMLGFLSFAYTYHYLNWFSKIEIIKWGNIPTKRLEWLAGIYIFSIAMYVYDYTYGFITLLFMSLLHVLLEFPLNIQTVRQIGGHIFAQRN